jgi:hypothetical protein
VVHVLPQGIDRTLRPAVFVGTVGSGTFLCVSAAVRAIHRTAMRRRAQDEERAVFAAAMGKLTMSTGARVDDGAGNDRDAGARAAGMVFAPAPRTAVHPPSSGDPGTSSSRLMLHCLAGIARVTRVQVSRLRPLAALTVAAIVGQTCVGYAAWGVRVAALSSQHQGSGLVLGVGGGGSGSAGVGGVGGSGSGRPLKRQFRDHGRGRAAGNRRSSDGGGRSGDESGNSLDIPTTTAEWSDEHADRDYLERRVRELSQEVVELRAGGGQSRGGGSVTGGGAPLRSRAEKDADDAATFSQRGRANLEAAATEEKRRQHRLTREMETEKTLLERAYSQRLRKDNPRSRSHDHTISIDVPDGKVTPEHEHAADLLRRLGRVARLDTSGVSSPTPTHNPTPTPTAARERERGSGAGSRVQNQRGVGERRERPGGSTRTSGHGDGGSGGGVISGNSVSGGGDASGGGGVRGSSGGGSGGGGSGIRRTSARASSRSTIPQPF